MTEKQDKNFSKTPMSGHHATRRKFITTGMKGLSLLPYVAPLMETYFISDTLAQGSGVGKGRGRVSPLPGKGRGGG